MLFRSLYLIWTTNISNYSDIESLFVTDGWNGSSYPHDFSTPSAFTIVSEACQEYPTPRTCTRVGLDNSGKLYFRVSYTSGDATDIAQGDSATIAWSASFNQPAIWEQLNASSTGDILFNGSNIYSGPSGNFVNLDVEGDAWMRLGTFDNKKDRKSTRLNSSHIPLSRMPSSA